MTPASTFYEYANNNPVDFSDPTGAQPAPGGPVGGFGGGGPGGGDPGPSEVTQSGPSEDIPTEAEMSDQGGIFPRNFFQPTLVLPRQTSVGQSAGGVYWADWAQAGSGNDTSSEDSGIIPVRVIIPFRGLPDDPNESPGPGFERRGPNWFHPPTRQSLHPNLNHPYPPGPHYDWHFQGNKQKLQIRQRGPSFEFWSEDLEEWLPFELLPFE